MISALRISNHDQNCFCRLIARHSRARIHALNLQRTSLTNTAHSPERAHSHQLARTACTTKSYLHASLSQIPVPARVPKSHSAPAPATPAALPRNYLLTRFRALAVFGRRPTERGLRSLLPASENLHKC